jgi:hypothetical protein
MISKLNAIFKWCMGKVRDQWKSLGISDKNRFYRI